MRRLFVPILAVSMAVGGLAYAAGDASGADTARMSDERPRQAAETGYAELLEAEPDGAGGSDEGDPTGSSAVTDTGRSTEGCPEGFSGNHGQFVSSTEDRPRRDAAHSPCGKPLQGGHDDEPGEQATEEVKSEDDDGGPGLKKGHDKDKNNSKAKHHG